MTDWISHRGNMFGRHERLEDSPGYVRAAVEAGFTTAVDLWASDERLFLGAEAPVHEVTQEFVHADGLLLLPRNDAALAYCRRHAELHALTTTLPEPLDKAIGRWTSAQRGAARLAFERGASVGDASNVLLFPERDDMSPGRLATAVGVCSDYAGLLQRRATAACRVALYVGGRLRCFEECLYPQWISMLCEHPDVWVDVFASVNAEPDDESRRFERLFLPAAIRYEPFVASERHTTYRLKFAETNAQNVMSMYFHNREAHRLVERYAERSGVTYSAMMKYRPDVEAPRLPPFLAGQDRVFIPAGGDFRGGLNDQIACGDAASMKVYSGVFDRIDDYLAQGLPLHPELLLACHLATSRMTVVRTDYAYTLSGKRASGTLGR